MKIFSFTILYLNPTYQSVLKVVNLSFLFLLRAFNSSFIALLKFQHLYHFVHPLDILYLLCLLMLQLEFMLLLLLFQHDFLLSSYHLDLLFLKHFHLMLLMTHDVIPW